MGFLEGTANFVLDNTVVDFVVNAVKEFVGIMATPLWELS